MGVDVGAMASGGACVLFHGKLAAFVSSGNGEWMGAGTVAAVTNGHCVVK